MNNVKYVVSIDYGSQEVEYDDLEAAEDIYYDYKELGNQHVALLREELIKERTEIMASDGENELVDDE